ncbi:unnamed protein product [Mytilus edulis]|uniref:Myb/SANT-like DNA-binding domain-containing protein n=1 Tax=Mytilus edulis TaxID=6550 RepID=A0A8S3R510_MYTED|nr:unnamed protein product [Mytilus edulis]
MLVNAVLKFNDVIKNKIPTILCKIKLPVLINMAANVSVKTSRDRKLNFTAVESNLISELATTHLELLQGKHSPEVTNAKKQEMWKEITSKVNALGVCLRTETEVRNRWRNLTRGAKQKFTTVQKERAQTGGGPPPTQPSQEPPQKKPKKKTADDVYSLQCQVLERKLIKTNLQIQLYERLHSKLDDNLTTGLLSFLEQ